MKDVKKGFALICFLLAWLQFVPFVVAEAALKPEEGNVLSYTSLADENYVVINDISSPKGINTDKKHLILGDSFELILNNVRGNVVWRSSNAGVVSIKDQGMLATVTAKKVGKTVVTAVVNNVEYKCDITVTKKLLSSNKKKVTVKKSKTKSVTIKLEGDEDDSVYAELASEDCDDLVSYKFGEWKGNKIKLKIKGLKKGKCTILVSNELTEETIPIRVTVK